MIIFNFSHSRDCNFSRWTFAELVEKQKLSFGRERAGYSVWCMSTQRGNWTGVSCLEDRNPFASNTRFSSALGSSYAVDNLPLLLRISGGCEDHPSDWISHRSITAPIRLAMFIPFSFRKARLNLSMFIFLRIRIYLRAILMSVLRLGNVLFDCFLIYDL